MAVRQSHPKPGNEQHQQSNHQLNNIETPLSCFLDRVWYIVLGGVVVLLVLFIIVAAVTVKLRESQRSGTCTGTSEGRTGDQKVVHTQKPLTLSHSILLHVNRATFIPNLSQLFRHGTGAEGWQLRLVSHQ